jgi:hypothetical protein
MPASVVEANWLMTSAMLMPLERMRVGINSERASQTQTPGPSAKNPMNRKRPRATSQPWLASGTWPIRAFSIFSGAVCAASRLPRGFLKKARTLLAGTQLARVISMGRAAGSSERTKLVAAVKSP